MAQPANRHASEERARTREASQSSELSLGGPKNVAHAGAIPGYRGGRL
jgi:hypothetical protein